MSMSPPFVAALVAVIACCTSPPLEAEDDVLLDVLQVTATRREMSNLEVSPAVTFSARRRKSSGRFSGSHLKLSNAAPDCGAPTIWPVEGLRIWEVKLYDWPDMLSSEAA